MISSILALGLLGVSVLGTVSQPLESVRPAMETVPNFDFKQFDGIWYEQTKYYDAEERSSKCNDFSYLLNEDGTVMIWNQFFDLDSQVALFNGAIATIPDKADASKFKIRTPGFPPIPESDYWIVGTDYKNYSVAFAFNQITPETIRGRAWILTRDPYPQPEIIEIAMKVSAAQGIDTSLYVPTDQTDCGY